MNRQRIDPAAQTIIIDLQGLSEITPTFIKFLVRLRGEAVDAGYHLHLVGVTTNLRRVLEISGVAGLFTYEATA